MATSTAAIENILSKNSGMTRDQAISVLNMQSDSGLVLREAIEKKGMQAPEDILAEVCRQMELEFIKDIPVNDIPVELISDIPISFAKAHEAEKMRLNKIVKRIRFSFSLERF